MCERARELLSPTIAPIVGGIVAVACGLALFALGGAPTSYLILNGAALLIGLALAGVLHWAKPPTRWIMVGGAALLLLTAVFGAELEGIRRWLMLGPVRVQPAFLVLPLMTVFYARDPSCRWGQYAMAISALALAIQPDRSMSSMLALVLIAVWAQRRSTSAGILVAWGVAGWAVTFLRADPLQAVPFVENMLADAFAMNILAAALATIGATAMIAPIFARRSSDNGSNFAHVAFAVCWVSLLWWSLIAPYPTPLLGYGASAIIGFFLSIVALRKPVRVLKGPECPPPPPTA